jgi:acetamidase/formamidase
MKKFTLKDQGEFCYSIDPKNEPRMHLDSGETLIVETEDASSGQIRTLTDKRDYKKAPYSNPQSGPFYINGAEKGDTLVVDLFDIRPTIGQGITRLKKWWWYLSHRESSQTMSDFLQPNIPDGLRIIQIEKNKVYFDELTLPYNPMIGTIGTAPDLEAVSTYLPGHHGGNMDLPCVTNGCRLYFPVRVSGALLHLGDAHAIQGEGEISGVAVEMPAEVTLKVDLIKNKVRIENDEYILGVGCTGVGRTLEDTIRLAYVNLSLWMEEYGINRWDAWELCSFLGKVTLGNIWCAAAGFPKKYLG